MVFSDVLDDYLGGKSIRCKAWEPDEYIKEGYFYRDNSKPHPYSLNFEVIQRVDWEVTQEKVGWNEAFAAMRQGKRVEWMGERFQGFTGFVFYMNEDRVIVANSDDQAIGVRGGRYEKLREPYFTEKKWQILD